MDIKNLIRQAIDARGMAYAPYSGFLVGAALLSADGRIYKGCNVENASYPLGNCAERTALFSAVCDGARAFSAIAVVGAPQGKELFEQCFPCGACRQALAEFFAPDTAVIVARSDEDYQVFRFSELLPHAFGAASMQQ